MRIIRLSKGYEAIVDDADYDELSRYRWHAYPNKSGVYACRTDHSGTSTKIRMHRQIMGLGYGRRLHVDHIDGNTLNNTRPNLRICTPSQNAHNKTRPAIPANHPTGIIGVTPHGSRWRASIVVSRRWVNLGLHDTIEAASHARREGELKHWGQYAPMHKAVPIINIAAPIITGSYG
jgi:hypothetical protein